MKWLPETVQAALRCCWGLAALLLAACGGEAPPPAAPAGVPAAQHPAAAASDPGRGGLREGSWLRAEAVRQRWPIAWEFREDFDPAGRALPQLAVVSLGRNINYSGQRDLRFEHELDQREQLLREAMGARLVLVAAMDWQLQHDWFYYAQADVSEAEIRAVLLGMPGRDVLVTLEPDADAKFYRALLGRVGAQP